MKDFISFYYQFYVSDIHLIDGKYFFSYKGNSYMFKCCIDIISEIDSIYELTKQLGHNKFYHQLVFNKDNSLITIFDGKPYIMLKLSFTDSMPISIFDIKGSDSVNVDKKLEKLVRFNWTMLWENKIDYFENYIFSKKDEFNDVLDSFYYYTGMAENAILYVHDALKNIKASQLDKFVVSHKRFSNSMSLLEFYDPTTLIIDHSSRDVAEFLKYLFLSNNYSFTVISDYLNNFKLSRLGAHLLIGRMLFPSFYFDSLEKYFFSTGANYICWLEDRIDDYNLFLMEIYGILSQQYEIQDIRWIIRKM